jgi:hypothetical protein
VAKEDWPFEHNKLDAIAAAHGIDFPPPPDGKQRLGCEDKIRILEDRGIPAPTEPQAREATTTNPQSTRDASYDELYNFALKKGNSEKAAAIFAETNDGRGGYVVDPSGELRFDRGRFIQGQG